MVMLHGPNKGSIGRKSKIYDGTRTRNLAIRSRMPYPLGHIDIFFHMCVHPGTGFGVKL